MHVFQNNCRDIAKSILFSEHIFMITFSNFHKKKIGKTLSSKYCYFFQFLICFFLFFCSHCSYICTNWELTGFFLNFWYDRNYDSHQRNTTHSYRKSTRPISIIFSTKTTFCHITSSAYVCTLLLPKNNLNLLLENNEKLTKQICEHIEIWKQMTITLFVLKILLNCCQQIFILIY